MLELLSSQISAGAPTVTDFDSSCDAQGQDQGGSACRREQDALWSRRALRPGMGPGWALRAARRGGSAAEGPWVHKEAEVVHRKLRKRSTAQASHMA
jgi:hypothetical protein